MHINNAKLMASNPRQTTPNSSSDSDESTIAQVQGVPNHGTPSSAARRPRQVQVFAGSPSLSTPTLSDFSALTSPGPSAAGTSTVLAHRSARNDLLEELYDSDDEDFDYECYDEDSLASADDFDEVARAYEAAIFDRNLEFVQFKDTDPKLQSKHEAVLQQGLSDGVVIDTVPDDWKEPDPKLDKGQIPFAQVDNPGDWNSFIFRPKFSAKKPTNYMHHQLSSGARPCPKKESDGTREHNGWTFHYEPWRLNPEHAAGPFPFRSGARTENLFPASRQGCLDTEVLKKLGLTKKRMVDHDALFWFQLILPLHDTTKTVEDDPRMPYFSEVEKFTGFYIWKSGTGGSYGHSVKPILVPELLAFHSALIRDGVKGGSKGGMFRLWDPRTSTYDQEVAKAMTLSRWRQIKRYYKMNDNDVAPKKGEPGYEPAYKFDLIYKVIVHNTNALSLRAELDQCGDETTWAFMGYGERGLINRIAGKPGVTKGGQIVLSSDVSRNRVRAYVHRHNFHPRPDGFTVQGNNEVRMIAEMLREKLCKEEGDGGLFSELPHFTFDNYFSGDVIIQWLGENGFGGLFTCRRDRLPRGVPKEFFHHERGTNGGSDKRTKVTKFVEPITAVKYEPSLVEGKDCYTRVHVSFQSTGSTNFSSVNSLNSNRSFVFPKSRGKGKDKRLFGIEMNDSRYVYLKSYFRIDTIDAMINHCHLSYRCMKYWHSPMNHGIALAIVTAYDMYQEAASGTLDPEWKLEKPMDFYTFRDRLSSQGLFYKPRNKHYPGDEMLRQNTRLSTSQKRKKHQVASKSQRQTAASVASAGAHSVQAVEFASAKSTKRLCGDFGQLADHLRSFVIEQDKARIKSGAKCAWCSQLAYTKCVICDVPLHNFPAKGKCRGMSCSLEYHNDIRFGLGFEDCKTLDSKAGVNWCMPSKATQKSNADHMKDLAADL